jgi:hypothetical protein
VAGLTLSALAVPLAAAQAQDGGGVLEPVDNQYGIASGVR